jgi:hypothetical protein
LRDAETTGLGIYGKLFFQASAPSKPQPPVSFFHEATRHRQFLPKR